MPTVYTRTVGTSSRQYSTITAAEAAVVTIATSADLVSNDEAVVFELYDDSVFNESVTFDGGLTTDATRNVTYRAAAGEQHDGDSGNGVRVNWTTAGTMFSVIDDHTSIAGLSLGPTANTNYQYVAHVSGGAIGVKFSDVRFESPSTNGTGYCGVLIDTDCGSSAHRTVVEDCAFLGFSSDTSAGVFLAATAASDVTYADLVNCTFFDCRLSTQAQYDASATVIVRFLNCLSLVPVTGDYAWIWGNSGTFTSTGSANNFGENSTFPGLGSPDPITGTTSATPGAGDWAIYTSSSDLALIDDTDNDVLGGGVGTTNSLVPATDILGNSRPVSTCDPGAWEVSAASGGVTGTGAAVLGGAVAAGTGTVAINSADSNVAALGAAVVAGTGTAAAAGITGTGAASLAAPTAAGVGTVAVAGTGAASLAGPTASGVGTVAVAGTGTTSLAGPTAAGTGTVSASGITGTGAASLAAPAALGAGTVVISGTGAMSLVAPTVAGVGTVDVGITGTGAALLTAPTASGTGTVAITGTGALSFGPAAAVGTNIETNVWDEMVADHQLPGSFGEAIQQIRLAAARAGSQRFS